MQVIHVHLAGIAPVIIALKAGDNKNNKLVALIDLIYKLKMNAS